MELATRLGMKWVEQGVLPDAVVRAGIRQLLRERLAEIQAQDVHAGADLAASFIAGMRDAPAALLPEKANEQHYEVPAEFFAQVLGKHRKYSGCYFPEGVYALDSAEEHALAMTCERAGIANGHDVLELGCGWGSLTLWMAHHYPASRITAVSNSHSQRTYIESQARLRGLHNVTVITCDMNEFATEERFDRIVSVEMFEHMRNWPDLFRRVSSWLQPTGKFFMHVFVHRSTPYLFVERDASDWMSRHFFSGGMMPSDDLALNFQEDLSIVQRWRWDGRHYERTSNAWLRNMDERRKTVYPVLEQAYGKEQAAVWWARWRLFFMSVAELFGYNKGQEWWVSHYLFERRP
ncbi:cyclopropane-fatty-acyl-phospholipid synthase family protein [Uliginosibacterium sp. H3]|uniref:Cyclopropane-fatty-acyl-phospholipid synthase family protein n=1 Tax=Uliginosibacterium silvisoli TaxID=3114758 RepID=A0ABU6K9V2_9RHOO|nr:cyclopropane-fatty-acyl-phospholipid synthase family protein [Uliginosibacterium sp. H3]